MKRSIGSSRPIPSRSALRKALTAMTPPSEELLLSREIQVSSMAIDRALSRYALGSAELHKALPRGQKTMGGHGKGSSIYDAGIGFTSKWISFMQWLYLPVGSARTALSTNRYVSDQVWPGAHGVANASKVSGRSFAYTIANHKVNNDSTYAGIYIQLNTTAAQHGKLSLARFEPTVEWSGLSKFKVDWEWGREVAGTTHIFGNLWLVAYVYNVATGKYEPLLNNSSVKLPLFHGSFNGSGISGIPQSGRFEGVPARLQCIIEPARSYLFGVVTQVRVSHNLLPAHPSRPIPQPKPGQFVAYGTIDANIPEMWLSHQVLTR